MIHGGGGGGYMMQAVARPGEQRLGCWARGGIDALAALLSTPKPRPSLITPPSLHPRYTLLYPHARNDRGAERGGTR